SAPVKAGAAHPRIDLDVEIEGLLLSAGGRYPAVQSIEIRDACRHATARSLLRGIRRQRSEQQNRPARPYPTQLLAFLCSRDTIAPRLEWLEHTDHAGGAQAVRVRLHHRDDGDARTDALADRFVVSAQGFVV